MNSYITPDDEVTVSVVNGAGMRRKLQAETQSTSESAHDALMKVAQVSP